MVNLTTTLTIQPGLAIIYPNMYIGNATYTDNGANIFTEFSGQTLTLPVTTDTTYMTTTIEVKLGYQSGSTDDSPAFTVSLMGQYLQTYSLECTTDIVTKWRTFESSCENYPTLATNYFNSTDYFD